MISEWEGRIAVSFHGECKVKYRMNFLYMEGTPEHPPLGTQFIDVTGKRFEYHTVTCELAVQARLWTLCRFYGRMDASKAMRRIKNAVLLL